MSGGISQLVAIGAQDAHLVGSPQVSFFRSNYRRHTNFTAVVDRQVIQGNPSANGMSSVRLERKGDLLSYVYLVKKTANAVEDFAADDIAKVELLIGGQVIDEQDYTFSNDIAQHLLTATDNKARMIPSKFYPLHFFFCENWQSALPLVALQYHDVELRITWGSGAGSHNYECWCEFILLDNVERQEMAAKTHEMLIYQVQKAVKSSGKMQEINFNHPVKFLAATSDLVSNPLTSTMKFQVNGVDVGDNRTYSPHFNEAPFYFHAPFNTDPLSGTPNSFLYPFCLDTNRLQPTGTLNFSRLDSSRFVTDAANGFDQADIYGVNYNILKVQNGMGGLLYAN